MDWIIGLALLAIFCGLVAMWAGFHLLGDLMRWVDDIDRRLNELENWHTPKGDRSE